MRTAPPETGTGARRPRAGPCIRRRPRQQRAAGLHVGCPHDMDCWRDRKVGTARRQPSSRLNRSAFQGCRRDPEADRRIPSRKRRPGPKASTARSTPPCGPFPILKTATTVDTGLRVRRSRTDGCRPEQAGNAGLRVSVSGRWRGRCSALPACGRTRPASMTWPAGRGQHRVHRVQRRTGPLGVPAASIST